MLALSYPLWRVVRRPPAPQPTATQPGTATATPASSRASGAPNDDAVISALVRDEETLLALAPKMDRLSRGLLDLRLPGPSADAQGVFGSPLTVRDLGAAPEATTSETSMLESRSWPIAVASTTITNDHTDLWRPLLDGVAYFEHATFSLVNGEHPGAIPGVSQPRGAFTAWPG
ncbi:MAG: hypothetical protein M5U12_20395 [Verrucomicrobia bacterium]|nr:hypothetical protein [Verrucomicrobiota bacterium]